MKIAELLSPQRVQLRADLRSKKRVLEELAVLLASSGADKDAAFASLVNREKLGTTGLGGGVAIPHGRLRGLDQATGAFMRLNPGVDYEAADGAPTDLIFALLVPEQATDEHLHILRLLAEMFVDEAFCARLRASANDADLHALLQGYQPASN